MLFKINDSEIEINDIISLVQLIDNSPENIKKEIVSSLLNHADFNDIITENKPLRTLLKSSISDDDALKVIHFILAGKNEFQRIISTSYDLRKTLLVINDEIGDELIQFVFKERDEFNRLFKNRVNFKNFLEFLEEDFPEYKNKFIETTIRLSDGFNELVGNIEELITFAKENLALSDKLIEKALSNYNIVSEITEFAKSIKANKLILESRKDKLLQPIIDKLKRRLLDKNATIKFSEFFETCGELLSETTKVEMFESFLASDNETLKLRIDDLPELIKALQFLRRTNLAKQLFSRVLNDHELFLHLIKDNQTLSNLWFMAEMDERHKRVFHRVQLNWLKKYLNSNDSVCILNGDYFSLKPGGYFLNINSVVKSEINYVLRREKYSFNQAIKNQNRDLLANKIQLALMNAPMLERLFTGKKQQSQLAKITPLIPHALAIKLVYQILQNQRLAPFFDLNNLPDSLLYNILRSLNGADQNKDTSDKLLGQEKTNPETISLLFKNAHFAEAFSAEELAELALSDEKIANAILEDEVLVNKISFQDLKNIIRVYPHTAHLIIPRADIGGVRLTALASINPEAANAILKTPKQLEKFRDRNSALVCLAIKHNETARFLFNDPELSKDLTTDNIIEIATSRPAIIGDILGNEPIMKKMNEEAKLLLAQIFSFEKTAHQNLAQEERNAADKNNLFKKHEEEQKQPFSIPLISQDHGTHRVFANNNNSDTSNKQVFEIKEREDRVSDVNKPSILDHVSPHILQRIGSLIPDKKSKAIYSRLCKTTNHFFKTHLDVEKLLRQIAYEEQPKAKELLEKYPGLIALSPQVIISLAKTEPGLVHSVLENEDFSSQFNQEQLCMLVLSDVKIAECILQQSSLVNKLEFKDFNKIVKTYPHTAHLIVPRADMWGLELLNFADIHPEAANAILKNQTELLKLTEHMGRNVALVHLAKKHDETARFLLNYPELRDVLTADNVIEIATSCCPATIGDILGNDEIMKKMNEAAELLLAQLFSLQLEQQDTAVIASPGV